MIPVPTTATLRRSCSSRRPFTYRNGGRLKMSRSVRGVARVEDGDEGGADCGGLAGSFGELTGQESLQAAGALRLPGEEIPVDALDPAERQ